MTEARYAAACRRIPGGVNSPVRAFGAAGGAPVFFARGEGPRLYDADGRAYRPRRRAGGMFRECRRDAGGAASFRRGPGAGGGKFRVGAAP